MATRSRIRVCIIGKRKTFAKSIYCHYDGYPSYMLPMLKENYNTPAKAKALVNLGNLSYVQKRLKPRKGEEHSFEKPAKGVTVAYHRDRGEPLKFISTYGNDKSQRQAYNYIFDGKTWDFE